MSESPFSNVKTRKKLTIFLHELCLGYVTLCVLRPPTQSQQTTGAYFLLLATTKKTYQGENRTV